MMRFETAAILAGGKSTRMGYDKLLLEVGGVRVVDSLIACLSTRFSQILLLTGEVTSYPGATVLPDFHPSRGPLGGIQTALMMSESQFVFVAACDMPNLDMGYVSFLENLLSDGRDWDACVALQGAYIEPFFGYYGKSLLSKLEDDDTFGNGSIHRLLDSAKVLYVSEEAVREFSPDWSLFLNLNTQENLHHHTKRRK